MEGHGRIFMGTHMHAQQAGFDMNFIGTAEGMHMHQPMPYPHPMMHGGGHFSPSYPVNQQYMQQQQQQHPLEEDIEVEETQRDDDVEEVPASQFPQADGRKKGASHRGSGFAIDEDRIICSAWLNISKDATTGTNQDKIAFYKRMWQYYLDNYDRNSKRSENSIQKRWSAIQGRVSRFCAILKKHERLDQSGKSQHDIINDAIKEYQKKEPWKLAHCWEILKDEPKWNDKVLELMQPSREQKQQASVDTQTQSENDVSSKLERPEGRDSAKRRRASRFQDTSSNSVAVDMLKQLNDRGQQMDEIDSKHKEEIINIERAKFELAQKQLQLKLDISLESNKMTRELTHEKLKVQKEMKEAELKVQMHAIDVEQTKVDTQIMFTDASKLAEGLREWVLKRQMDIMIRDGVKPAGAGSSSKGPGGP